MINHIQDGFQELYKSQHPTSIAHSDFEVNWATTFTEEDLRMLSANISPLEIRKALFSLKPYKSLGADDLHVGVFHHFWPTLGSLVIEEVQNIFASKKMLAYFNQMLVVLIPKRIGLKLLGHFRPISLCPAVCKIISKIIINKIRPL